jgi:hypothetical protein
MVANRAQCRQVAIDEGRSVTHRTTRRVPTTLQDLRRRARATTPTLLLPEASERLAIRLILSARRRSQPSRQCQHRGRALAGEMSASGDEQILARAHRRSVDDSLISRCRVCAIHDAAGSADEANGLGLPFASGRFAVCEVLNGPSRRHRGRAVQAGIAGWLLLGTITISARLARQLAENGYTQFIRCSAVPINMSKWSNLQGSGKRAPHRRPSRPRQGVCVLCRPHLQHGARSIRVP